MTRTLSEHAAWYCIARYFAARVADDSPSRPAFHPFDIDYPNGDPIPRAPALGLCDAITRLLSAGYITVATAVEMRKGIDHIQPSYATSNAYYWPLTRAGWTTRADVARALGRSAFLRHAREIRLLRNASLTHSGEHAMIRTLNAARAWHVIEDYFHVMLPVDDAGATIAASVLYDEKPAGLCFALTKLRYAEVISETTYETMGVQLRRFLHARTPTETAPLGYFWSCDSDGNRARASAARQLASEAALQHVHALAARRQRRERAKNAQPS